MAKCNYPFSGRIAVVSGASRGIGKATAWALAEKECRVILVARQSIALDETWQSLISAGLDAEKFPCDLNSRVATDQLIDTLLERFSEIDILVNCAGVGKFGPFDNLTPDEVRAPLLVPLQSTIVLSHGLLPSIKASGMGRIVNMIGPAAYFDLPWMAAYTASRTGLLSFTRALDEEISSEGVRVKSVCPAWVDTEYISRNQTDGDWLPAVSRYFPVSSPEQAACFVLLAITSNQREIKPSWLLRFCALSYRCFPRLSINAFKLAGLYRPPALNGNNRNSEGAQIWTNWEESISLDPVGTVFPSTIEEVCQIVSDPQKYPGPLRPAGSRHSTTHCGVTDGGTLMIMRKMDRIINIDKDDMTVTVEAGALYIDVAKTLQQTGLQFYVNVEIGNLTMGSAASTGTKDASMYQENGQVCSYCVGVKLVTANGIVAEITEKQPKILQNVRSSYGLYGVVVETTFRIKPLQAMAVFHKTYTLDEFENALPQLWNQEESMMYYLFPFQNKLTVEFRRYVDKNISKPNRWVWPLRNLFWKTIAPAWGYGLTKWVSHRRTRYVLIDAFYGLVRVAVCRILRNEKTIASDQIIRYPERKGATKYTFSIWAFREENIMQTMRAYYAFCQDYYAQHGFRCNMLNVGYRIQADQNPLFSYSWDGTVMTLDPVHTGGPGWDRFLRAYNDFCSEFEGVPLFNQTKWLTRSQVSKAFGNRVQDFWKMRTEFDPDDRFLNRYFTELLGPEN